MEIDITQLGTLLASRLRTITVDKFELGEVHYTCHRYFVGDAGELSFATQVADLAVQGGIVEYVTNILAPGTWRDARDITPTLKMRAH